MERGREVCLLHDLLNVCEERVLVSGVSKEVWQREVGWRHGTHTAHGTHRYQPGRHHAEARGEAGGSSGSHGVLEDESLCEGIKEGIGSGSDHLWSLVSLPPPEE